MPSKIIILEGIDPNTEAGKFYAANQEAIGKNLMEALRQGVENQAKDLLKFNKNFLVDSARIKSKLLNIFLDKTIAGCRLLAYGDVFMRGLMKMLDQCNNKFTSLSSAEREEFLKDLPSTTKFFSDIYKSIQWLESDWRRFKDYTPKPISSVPEELNKLRSNLTELKGEVNNLTNSLPEGLRKNVFIESLFEIIGNLERGLSEAGTALKELNNKNSAQAEFDAAVERRIAYSKLALDKYNQTTAKLAPAHKLLLQREAAKALTSTNARLSAAMPAQQATAEQATSNVASASTPTTIPPHAASATTVGHFQPPARPPRPTAPLPPNTGNSNRISPPRG